MGDGLICFSILDGLARRGHNVFALTPYSAIRTCSPGLHVRPLIHAIPADSLAGWEYLWRAGRVLKHLVRTERIDVTWRMHPYNEGCPGKPPTLGRPLVIGPLFYGWPVESHDSKRSVRHRFGFGIGKYLRPFARRGWDRAMATAGLNFVRDTKPCSRSPECVPKGKSPCYTVMVDPPSEGEPRARWSGQGPFRLVFVANLVPGKNPRLFCEVGRRASTSRSGCARNFDWRRGQSEPRLKGRSRPAVLTNAFPYSVRFQMQRCSIISDLPICWCPRRLVSRTGGASLRQWRSAPPRFAIVLGVPPSS